MTGNRKFAQVQGEDRSAAAESGPFAFMPDLKIGSRRFRLPASRIARIIIGVLFVIMGMFGFLPILGFWMIPVGLLILSHDIARVRRWRRRSSVWWTKRRNARAAARNA